MRDIKKEQSKTWEGMFQKEFKVVAGAEEIASNNDLSRDELHEEYLALSRNYEKLLKEMVKITRVGDKNYRKLMEANEQIQRQKGELEVLNRELRKANAAKDKLYSIIAHDLRNPLGFLLFSSDFLESEYKNKRLDEGTVKKYIEKVLKTARNMSGLLENLLLWSRSQQGAVECCPRKIDLFQLASEAIENFVENAEKKGVRLTLEIQENTTIYADDNMVRAVLRNLVDNAVKFTGASGEVKVSCEEEGDYCWVAIRDTGVGIPRDKLEGLFLTGEISSTTGTEGEKGSGLGLILCKEFVEKNGGKIRVTSTPGKGSMFEFSLPKRVTENPGASSPG